MNNETYSDRRLYGRFYYYFVSPPIKEDLEIGFSFVSNKVCRLAKGASWSDLNTAEGAQIVNFRESGLMFNLGFWQFTVGVRVKSK